MKKSIMMFFLILILATSVFWGFIKGHYSTDDYNIMNIGYNQYSIMNNLREGRPVMYLIDQLALKFSLSYDAFISLTVIIAVIITSVTVIIFYNYIIKYYDIKNTINNIAILLCSYTVFFNFMYIENLYFVESIVMATALLLYLISAIYLVEQKNYVVAIIIAIIANFCYNGFQCYYVTLVTFLSLIKNDEYKKTIAKLFVSGLIVILAVVLNLIQIKACCDIFNLSNNRFGNTNSILTNVLYIFYGIVPITIGTAGLFPKGCYFLFVLYFLLSAIICSLHKQDRKITISIVFITLVSILSCYCIFLFTISSFGCGRLLYAMGMTIGVQCLLLIKTSSESYYRIIIFVFIIYFILNIYNGLYVVKSSRIVNEYEKNEIINLEKEIKDHEEKENINVDRIVYIYKHNTGFNNYVGIHRNSTATDRALGCDWSCCGAISFYTKRNFNVINKTKEIQQVYDEKESNKLNGIMIYKDMLICPISSW